MEVSVIHNGGVETLFERVKRRSELYRERGEWDCVYLSILHDDVIGLFGDQRGMFLGDGMDIVV